MSQQAKSIREYIIKNLEHYPGDIVAMAAKHFLVTRTTVHRHLNYLIKQGLIIKSGTTRDVRYNLQSRLARKMSYKISRGLSEFNVFKSDFEDIFLQFPKNIYDICLYGFTEIFNNAIDHSEGRNITVSTEYANDCLRITIDDDGIGLFSLINEYLKLEDIREAILQISKGKITTSPAHHSGEGIFFTSRVFDCFDIYANNLHYFRDNLEKDWGLETLSNKTKGTSVCLSIQSDSKTKLVEVFEHYQDPQSLSFNRTEILIKLSQYGDTPLISRSQAKRIIIGLEKFQHITLDFSGVRLIGQGFVDELFRVFLNQYPGITIEYVHANPDVQFMIQRSL